MADSSPVARMLLNKESMLQFSISAILDGLIHLGAFLCACAGLYLLLSVVAKNKFESHVGRTIAVVLALAIARLYMSSASWADNIVTVIAVLFALSFFLIFKVLRAALLASCLLAMVLVSLMLGLEHVATQFSAKVMPKGTKVAESMGLAQKEIYENKGKEGLEPTDVGDVMGKGKGQDALATLTEEEEQESVTQDFGGEDGGNLLDTDTQGDFASSHFKRKGTPVESERETDLDVLTLQSEDVVDELEVIAEEEPFIPIKINFGVVLLPKDEPDSYAWIIATQKLRMQGYVSLGDEVVILREDGAMLRRKDLWTVDAGDYTYSFIVEEILENRVSLRAAGRELIMF